MKNVIDKIISLAESFEKKAQAKGLGADQEYQYQIYTMGIALRELRDSVAPIDNLIDATHEESPNLQVLNEMKRQIDIVKGEIDKKYDVVKKNYVSLASSAIAANKK